MKNIETEIIVIDNCSTDNSKEYFSGRFPEVQFVWQTENTGFAKANNYAMQMAKADHVLFLNPDTILTETVLKKCLLHFTKNPDCGACGIRMLDGTGSFLPESKRTFPGIFSSLLKLGGGKRSSYYDVSSPENEVGETQVLSGAFLMMSRSAIHVTKGFDTDFFMYGEDIDLSYRIHKCGLKNYYLGDVSIIHFKGESTKKRSQKYYNDFYGAMRLFVKKHYNKFSAFFINHGIDLAKKWAYLSDKKDENPKGHVANSQPHFYIINKTESCENVKNLIISSYPQAGCTIISTECNLEEFMLKFSKEGVRAKQDRPFLVLCIPAISYAEALQLVEIYGQYFYCLFHNVHTKCLVGSYDKNHPGLFISN